MINRVVLMGRMVADPELKTTGTGVSVSTFRIAVDRSYVAKGAERQTDFFDVVAWRSTAEFLCRNFRKGSLIAIDGQLQTRQYQTKDGQNRTVVEVVADDISFTGERRNSAETPTDGRVSREMPQGGNLYGNGQNAPQGQPAQYQTADNMPMYSNGASYDPRYPQGQLEPRGVTPDDDLPWNRGR